MITCLELHITSFVTWKQQKCALPLKYTGALGKYNRLFSRKRWLI